MIEIIKLGFYPMEIRFLCCGMFIVCSRLVAQTLHAPWLISRFNSPSSGKGYMFNSSYSAAYMRQWFGSALIQILACRLFGAKTLSKQMLGYCHGHLGTDFSEVLIKIQNFSFTKMHLKLSSAKWRLFSPGGDELKRLSIYLTTGPMALILECHHNYCLVVSGSIGVRMLLWQPCDYRAVTMTIFLGFHSLESLINELDIAAVFYSDYLHYFRDTTAVLSPC